MSDLLRTPTPYSPAHPGMHPGANMARSISRVLRRDDDRPPLRLLPDSGTVRHRFRGGLAGGALRRVRAYIDDHIGEHISLDELARQAGVSRFHFARQFRLSTGESAMGYLRRVRIERSKRILQTRDATIAEVAARLGFSDQSHFTRTFGRLVGVSPGSFARSDDWSSHAVAGERA
jgi:AraC family transcriptional regulator